MPAVYNDCLQKQIRDNLEARQREQQEWDKEYNQQGFTEVQKKGETNFSLSNIFLRLLNCRNRTRALLVVDLLAGLQEIETPKLEKGLSNPQLPSS